MHCNSFVTKWLLYKKWYYLILGIIPLCPDHCINPPRHALYQFLTNIYSNFIPLNLYPLPKLIHPSWCIFIFSKPPFEMIPKMLNWIEVLGLIWPWHEIESMGLKSLLRLFASVLWIIVLLENNILGVFVVKLQAWLKVILQNLSVEVNIHPPINPSSKSRPFPQHTAPNHEWSTTKFLCSLN